MFLINLKDMTNDIYPSTEGPDQRCPTLICGIITFIRPVKSKHISQRVVVNFFLVVRLRLSVFSLVFSIYVNYLLFYFY